MVEENIDAAHMELVFPFSELSACHWPATIKLSDLWWIEMLWFVLELFCFGQNERRKLDNHRMQH